MTAQESLAGRAVASVLWLMLGRWGQLIIGLGTLAVMGRFLGPEIYGAYSLAILAMTAADVLVFGTFSDAVVRQPTLDRAHVGAAFLISIALSAILALAVLLGADTFAAIMRAPDMAKVLPWIGLAILLLAFGVVPAALLQRDLRQRPLVLIEQSAITVSSLVGIALAIGGAGIWSLMAMELVRAAWRTTALVRTARWRPSVATNREALVDVWRFGASMVGVKSLQFLDRLIPRLTIGYVLGTAAVGHFALGWRLYEQLQKMLVAPMSGVAMATAARANGDMGLIRQLFLGAARASCFIAYPAFVGAAAVAPTAIPLFFGPQWHEAVLPAQILCLIGMRAAVTGFNGGILRGIGRGDLQLRLALISVCLTAIAVPVAVNWGLAAVALALLVRSMATWPIGAAFLSRTIGLPARAQARVGLEAAIAAFAMAAVVLTLQHVFGHWPAPLLLALLLGAGFGIYVALVALLAPASARELLRGLRAFARGDRSAARRHLAGATQLGTGAGGTPAP